MRTMKKKLKNTLQTKKKKPKQVLKWLTKPCAVISSLQIKNTICNEPNWKYIPYFKYSKNKEYVYKWSLNQVYKIRYLKCVGRGAYSEIHKVIFTDATGKQKDMIVKHPKKIDKSSSLRELYFHTLLYCDYGNHIPRIMNVFKIKSQILYGVENMDGTLWDYFDEHIDDQMQLVRALYSITCILHELQEKYTFMHRDFHPGNIMYKKVVSKYIWYFIDFNMSCMKIKEKRLYQMSSTGHYNVLHNFNSSHDMRMLIVFLYLQYMNKLPTELLHYILSLLDSFVKYYSKKNKYHTDNTDMLLYGIYGDVVHIVDDNFDPLHVSLVLKNIIDRKYILNHEHKKYRSGLLETNIQTSRNIVFNRFSK